MSSAESVHRKWLLAAALIAALGASFSLVSTLDFVQHLDRQVHSLHCSFVPGAGADLGESGCRAAMLSPYSSFLRKQFWGGVPISLGSLAVFSYLVFLSASLALKPTLKRSECLYALAAWAFPCVVSAVYIYLATTEVGQFCKVCVGIYVSSFLGLGVAVAANLAGAAAGPAGDLSSWLPAWAKAFAVGDAFVFVLVAVYLALAPRAELKKCGTLVKPQDSNGIMLSLSQSGGDSSAIEVLDPLCPACRAFETRLEQSGATLARKAVLFPLDSTCNWMVGEKLHPGACTLSEALLCAGPLDKEASPQKQADNTRAVLAWSFSHQEELKAEVAKGGDQALKARVAKEFPELAKCIGSSVARNRLNKSLRWAVANAIPVLTPQLYVGNSRLCDEDTDLGLEYALAQLTSGGTP